MQVIHIKASKLCADQSESETTLEAAKTDLRYRGFNRFSTSIEKREND
ncbi:MAG: hypothetical protein IKQ17_13710 [Kiritimatiellae bacterium]|nr:hypothetical protein [Kiritimatiellia bacterium]